MLIGKKMSSTQRVFSMIVEGKTNPYASTSLNELQFWTCLRVSHIVALWVYG